MARRGLTEQEREERATRSRLPAVLAGSGGGDRPITLVVLGGLGLDISSETVPYVAGWGEDGALEAVSQFAQLIDSLARRVEAALTAPNATTESGRAG